MTLETEDQESIERQYRYWGWRGRKLRTLQGLPNVRVSTHPWTPPREVVSDGMVGQLSLSIDLWDSNVKRFHIPHGHSSWHRSLPKELAETELQPVLSQRIFEHRAAAAEQGHRHPSPKAPHFPLELFLPQHTEGPKESMADFPTRQHGWFSCRIGAHLFFKPSCLRAPPTAPACPLLQEHVHSSFHCPALVHHWHPQLTNFWWPEIISDTSVQPVLNPKE